MVVTRRGAAGVCVASHVTGELRLALVRAPIPLQHTEDEAAFSGDWDQLYILYLPAELIIHVYEIFCKCMYTLSITQL